MKKFNKFKLIGIVGTALGLASTLIANYADDRVMEETVKEEVNKALAAGDEEA